MPMKILTNAQYNAICDIVSDLQKENRRLKNDKAILLNILNPQIFDIDFPNSQKGGGHDIGNIDINDILNN